MRQIPAEGSSTNTLPLLLQIVIKNKITDRKGLSRGDTKCNVVSYIGSWNRKKTLGATKAIHNHESILIH